MRIFYNFIAFWAIGENAIAAEAGIPQLNPGIGATQTFWLIVVLQFFIYQYLNSLYQK